MSELTPRHSNLRQKDRAEDMHLGIKASVHMPYEESIQNGGVLWRGADLAGSDAGYSLLNDFIDKHPHEGWTLSIYNVLEEATAEIDCPVEAIPQITSCIFNLEHAAPMVFIGENALSESYVVGICCTRGRLSFPGLYRAEGGKVIPIFPEGLSVTE